MSSSRFPEINAYIATQPEVIRTRLTDLCCLVEAEVPEVEGRISYNMPAYFLNGSLVYFCGFKKHIGFYPASSAVFREFHDQLLTYKQSGKGTVQFPHNRDFPLEVFRAMVRFRVAENLVKKGDAP